MAKAPISTFDPISASGETIAVGWIFGALIGRE
jgi:hypothetical protein